MKVAAIRVELHIGSAQSLKQKRSVLRPIVERLRRDLSVSVAEVDHQDTWQRSALGVALVASEASRLDALVDRVRRHFDRQLESEMIGFTVTYMEEPGE